MVAVGDGVVERRIARRRYVSVKPPVPGCAKIRVGIQFTGGCFRSETHFSLTTIFTSVVGISAVRVSAEFVRPASAGQVPFREQG